MAKHVAQPAPSNQANDPRSEFAESLRAQRKLVTRIVASPYFIKSERLSTFLAYVCDMSLQGKEGEISEQKIGQAVFGRSQDYDSAVDGIVRTQASRLRQRLDSYFENEGAEEPIRLLIPRGGYVPVFQSREPQVAAQGLVLEPEMLRVPALPDAEPASGPVRVRALPWILSLLLGLLFLGAIVSRKMGPAAYFDRSAVHPLWGRIFTPDVPTLMVPADSGLVLYTGIAARQVTLAEYLRSDYRAVPEENASLPRRQLSDFANRRYTSIVDLQIATTLSQFALKRGSRMDVRYCRDVRPNDLKSGNVILIGAAEANPWVELFERKMNFVFVDDFATHIFSVLNRAPRPGEPRQWDSAAKDPQSRVYGVVAFMPNLTANGDVLILEGTSMSGTEAAWDFVDDDSQLLPFLKRIRRPDGSIPHFELVLGTNNMGASAVQDTVLAWRTSN